MFCNNVPTLRVPVFELDDGVNEIEVLPIGQHIVTISKDIGYRYQVITVKITTFFLKPQSLNEVTVNLILGRNGEHIGDIPLGQYYSHSTYILADTLETIASVREEDVVYQMLIDGVRRMHLLDYRLRKRVPQFDNLLSVWGKINNAFA